MGLVTIISNGTDLGLHPSTIILARRRAKRAEAVSGEIGRRMHVRQRKGEMMYQHPRWIRGSDVEVRFGSGSGPFALNAEPEPGVLFGQLPNLEPERAFTFGSVFERVRTENF
jgi:hypothetical protein